MAFALTSARPGIAGALADLMIQSRAAAMPWLKIVHSRDETVAWMEGTVIASSGVTVACNAETIATAAPEILGFVAARSGWIDHLYVAPQAQGQGVGAQLLGHALSVWPRPMQLWVFQRNVRAGKFYETRGFKPVLFTDGRANEEDEPDVLYRLTSVSNQ